MIMMSGNENHCALDTIIVKISSILKKSSDLLWG